MARKLKYNEEEGGMAKAQLQKIESYAAKLNEMIHPEDELEGWVQNKLSVVAAYMGDIKHYLDYELKQNFGDGGGVGKQRHWEVEFTWDDAREEESREVNVMANDVTDAENKVKEKFGPYYKGLRIIEVEEDKEMSWDEYSKSSKSRKYDVGGQVSLDDLMMHDDLYYVGHIFDTDSDGWVSKEDAESILQEVNEGRYKKGGQLIGNQKKLDLNKNGKLDAEDFRMLRARKKLAWGGKMADGGDLMIQDDLYKLVLGMDEDEYVAFAKVQEVDIDDTNAMEDFIYELPMREAKMILADIKKGKYKGGKMAEGGEIKVGDKVKYKNAKYHATVTKVVEDVDIPYAVIEYSDGKVKQAHLEDLHKVILGVAPEYVNPDYMADGGMAKGGNTSSLTKKDIKVIDDRIEYFFENNEYKSEDEYPDSETLADYVVEGGEIDAKKHPMILKYIKNQMGMSKRKDGGMIFKKGGYMADGGKTKDAALGNLLIAGLEYTKKFKIGGNQKLQKIVGEDLFYMKEDDWAWNTQKLAQMNTSQLNNLTKKIENLMADGGLTKDVEDVKDQAKKVYVEIAKPSDLSLNRVSRQIEEFANLGYKSADILLKMAFVTTDEKALTNQFQTLKNKVYLLRDVKKYAHGGETKMEDVFMRYEGSTFYEDFQEAKEYLGDDLWKMMTYEEKVEATKYLKATGKIGWFGEMEDVETLAASQYKKGGKVTDQSVIDFVKTLEQSKIMAKDAHKNTKAIDTIKGIVSMSRKEYNDYIKENPSRNVSMIYSEYSDWVQTYKG